LVIEEDGSDEDVDWSLVRSADVASWSRVQWREDLQTPRPRKEKRNEA
jgi:hypothetical protein